MATCRQVAFSGTQSVAPIARDPPLELANGTFGVNLVAHFDQ
jgi:hypothetical protein